MFVGESTHTLDSKSRVFVPKRIQDEIPRNEEGERAVVITRGFERCLFLFPGSDFEQMIERLRTQAFGGEELRRMQRLFFSNAHRASVDGSGRLLIPEKLRKVAGLEKEVVIVGVADRVEMWSQAAWDAFNESHDAEFDNLDVVLCGEDGPPGEG